MDCRLSEDTGTGLGLARVVAFRPKSQAFERSGNVTTADDGAVGCLPCRTRPTSKLGN